jgi:hypothetical protein
MAQNGMGEIKAVEALLALAKKARVRSSAAFTNAKKTFESISELNEAAGDAFLDI